MVKMYHKLVVFRVVKMNRRGNLKAVTFGNADFYCKNFVPTLADIRENQIVKVSKFDNAVILNIIDLSEVEKTEAEETEK